MKAIFSAVATMVVGVGLTGLVCWWLVRRRSVGSAVVSIVVGVAATLIVALVARPIEVIWDGILQTASPPSSPTAGPAPSSPSASPAAPGPAATQPPSGASPSANKGSGYPVSLSATATGGRTVAVEAVTKREPAAGNRFWLVLEVHGVSGSHSEFYPRHRLENQRQKSEFTLEIPPDAQISRTRTGRVVEVSAEVDTRFRSGRPDPEAPDHDFLLAPPCCPVSAEVTFDFTD